MISKVEKREIEQMIAAAEKKSCSELVPMVVSKSDIYPAAHFRAALIISFLFSLGLYYSPLSIINPIYFLWVQVLGLLVGYFLAQIPTLTRILITQKEIETEVTQKAIEAFYEHNLHATQKHNGVLIFISLMERKIKIICDVGVKQKVEQKIWDEVTFAFTEKVRTESLAAALKDTIDAASNILENYFPSTPDARNNELKNTLIVE